VVTRLYIVGITYYDATYQYGLFDSTYYLRRVSVYGDTTLARGGLEFYNIWLNGTLIPQSSVRPGGRAGPRHRGSYMRSDMDGTVFSFAPASHGRRLVIHDLLGRRLHAVRVPGGWSRVAADGTPSRPRAASAFHIARLGCATCDGTTVGHLLCR
jgi:hypothetical protein